MESGKLIKLLQLSQSPNDHEALAAIRKANALLERENLDWNGIFSRLLINNHPSVIITFGAQQNWTGTGTTSGVWWS